MLAILFVRHVGVQVEMVFAFAASTAWAATALESKALFLENERAGVRGDHRIILGIDPGLANTGWGIVEQDGSRLRCLAYGCVSTPASMELSQRLLKIAQQIGAVVDRFKPTCVGIETVWFGQNITAAFSTGQARGAALVACAQGGLMVGEFTHYPTCQR